MNSLAYLWHFWLRTIHATMPKPSLLGPATTSITWLLPLPQLPFPKLSPTFMVSRTTCCRPAPNELASTTAGAVQSGNVWWEESALSSGSGKRTSRRAVGHRSLVCVRRGTLPWSPRASASACGSRRTKYRYRCSMSGRARALAGQTESKLRRGVELRAWFRCHGQSSENVINLC